MTDLRKAAEMALESLEIGDSAQRSEAIIALSDALAQPEQDPVAWMNNDYEVFFDRGKAACYSMGWIKPLYTAPPKREWQGLTDEEIEQGLLRSDYALQTAHAWRSGVIFAMTKLKEKNNE